VRRVMGHYGGVTALEISRRCAGWLEDSAATLARDRRLVSTRFRTANRNHLRLQFNSNFTKRTHNLAKKPDNRTVPVNRERMGLNFALLHALQCRRRGRS
jgi:hypothetical protein